MICNKCNVDKPLDQYFVETKKDTGKQYRKKYCLDCFREQARNWKARNKTIVKTQRRIKNILDAGGKICIKCNTPKHKDEYYINRSKCKECVREEERVKDELARNARIKKQIDAGISTKRVPNKPGDFADDLQKQSSIQILTAIGWSYNEQNGVFYKLPLKDYTGRWLILNEDSNDNLLRKRRRSKIRSKITKQTLPKVSITKNRRKNTPSDEIINQICYEYFIEKKTMLELQIKYKTKTIHQYICLVYQMLEDNV
jgi:hypothetical protein